MERIYPKHPPAIGPYSPAVKVGPWLFIAGQIALKPDGTVETSSIAQETQRVLENLKAVLDAAGAQPHHLVKVTIFLTDMAFFPQVNAIYQAFFPDNGYPARETVAVSALPRGARIEISGIAYLGE
ncbi:MAG: RidA family protein [Bacteroidia bacterium]